MKVTAEHLANLAQAIEPLDTPERRTAYRNGDFPRAEHVKDLDKRYRWDLFWAAWDAAGQSPDFLAQYSDSHIDTALRRIVPVLGDGTNDEIVTPEPATEADKRAAVQETATELFGEGAEVQDDGTIAFPEPADEPPTPEQLADIARSQVNQAVAITLADGRSFSTKVLAVIQRSPERPAQLMLKGWAYESGTFNPFAVVKYPLAQVADFAPFGADQFVAV